MADRFHCAKFRATRHITHHHAILKYSISSPNTDSISSPKSAAPVNTIATHHAIMSESRINLRVDVCGCIDTYAGTVVRGLRMMMSQIMRGSIVRYRSNVMLSL